MKIKLLLILLVVLTIVISGCPEPPPEEECETIADCEGLPPIDCEGEWSCVEGECAWTCFQPPWDCVEAGGITGGQEECCEGLTAIGDATPDAEEPDGCLYMEHLVCLKLGDGICDDAVGENSCNSPEDCAEEESCTKEGEIAGALECCEGLTAVADGIPDPENLAECKYMMHAVCLPVGDGVCSEYESYCTSPDDCADHKKCGNGTCEPEHEETADNCSVDCPGT